MSKSTSAKLSDLDQFRYDVLCGLMADPPRPAVDEAIYRRLLFSGERDVRVHKVRRSLPSLAEHIGRDRGVNAEDHNRQVRAAHKRLRTEGLVKARRENNNGRVGRGRGYAYHHLLPECFEGRKKPHMQLAYWAAKRVSLAVSDIGPSLEQTLLRVWWHLGSDSRRTQPLNDWAAELGLSRATALKRLRDLGASNVGMTFEELLPEPREEGDVGRKPKRYHVSAVLPPHGRLPDGAARHRARQQEEREMVRALTTASVPDESAGWMEGPDGTMVPAPNHGEDEEDLPEEFFGPGATDHESAAEAAAGEVVDEPEDSRPEGDVTAELGGTEAAPVIDSEHAAALEPVAEFDEVPAARSEDAEDDRAAAPEPEAAPTPEPQWVERKAAPVAAAESPELLDVTDAPPTEAATGAPMQPDGVEDGGDGSSDDADEPNDEPAKKLTPAELRARALKLHRELMYPELVEKLIEDAEGQLQEGHKVTLSRRVHNFYEPVIAAQKKYGAPSLIKYALDETHNHGALRKPRNRGWAAYFEVVCQNNEKGFKGGGPDPGTNAHAKAAASPDGLSKRLRERLSEAYVLNREGRTGEAKEVLALLLEKAVPLLIPGLFDGDAVAARAGVIEAFKRGSSDGLQRDAQDPKFAVVDYLPESAWPHDARLACEVARVRADESPAAAPSPSASREPNEQVALDVEGVRPPAAAAMREVAEPTVAVRGLDAASAGRAPVPTEPTRSTDADRPGTLAAAKQADDDEFALPWEADGWDDDDVAKKSLDPRAGKSVESSAEATTPEPVSKPATAPSSVADVGVGRSGEQGPDARLRARFGAIEPKPRAPRDKRAEWVERVNERLATADRLPRESLPGLASEFARQARVVAIAEGLDGQTAYRETETRLRAAFAAGVGTWPEAELLDVAV